VVALPPSPVRPDHPAWSWNDGTVAAIPDRDQSSGMGGHDGLSAVHLALLAGARAVLLLGFDASVIDGREHFWARVGGAPRRHRCGAQRRLEPCHAALARVAREIGVPILNASPNTMVESYERADLDAVLSGTIRTA
jgi:hypothetical protein